MTTPGGPIPASGRAPKPTRLLVLGLGNLLLGDDGLGPVAVDRLTRRYDAPEGVLVLDGGTLGLSLLPHLEDAQRALLIDAIRADGPPGTLVRLEGEDVAPAVAARLSPHQVGVVDLLDGARWRDRYPEPLILLGVVPGSLGLRVGLSPSVEAALPALLERIVAETAALGFPFSPRAEGDDSTAARRAGALPLVFGV
jgi:hydrogenase maturation protease